MGQDYADTTGTPVFSADSGRVIYSEWAGRSGYAVAVRSAKADARGLLLDSYYYHLKQGSLALLDGQPVSAGQFLALSDDSGKWANGKPSSHGPHVHFEIHMDGDSSSLGAVDPIPFMNQVGAPLVNAA